MSTLQKLYKASWIYLKFFQLFLSQYYHLRSQYYQFSITKMFKEVKHIACDFQLVKFALLNYVLLLLLIAYFYVIWSQFVMFLNLNTN